MPPKRSNQGPAGVIEVAGDGRVVIRRRTRQYEIKVGTRLVIEGTSYCVVADDAGELCIVVVGKLTKVQQPIRQLAGWRVEL